MSVSLPLGITSPRTLPTVEKSSIISTVFVLVMRSLKLISSFIPSISKACDKENPLLLSPTMPQPLSKPFIPCPTLVRNSLDSGSITLDVFIGLSVT